MTLGKGQASVQQISSATKMANCISEASDAQSKLPAAIDHRALQEAILRAVARLGAP